MTSHDLPLGRAVDYPRHYDPTLLFRIPRAQGRANLGLRDDALRFEGLPIEGLPFEGMDRWHAYELGWLDARGKPIVATATITVPATSPRLIESKSLKLYLNSLNSTRFDAAEIVRGRIAGDLSLAAGAPVEVAFGLPAIAETDTAVVIDALELDIAAYDAPDPSFLVANAIDRVEETLRSDLLKSNCPVTGQPDWASVRIAYRGPRIDHSGLLRYLVSFREHAEFHEQCVERIFVDLMARCRPDALAVEARYTRRGGLDINPWRTTPGLAAPAAGRDPRQ
jgi:7-cyano-7-deazaguanine reductase